MSQPVGGRRAWRLEPRDRRAALLYCTCGEELPTNHCHLQGDLLTRALYYLRRRFLLPGEELLQDLPGLPDGPGVLGTAGYV